MEQWNNLIYQIATRLGPGFLGYLLFFVVLVTVIISFRRYSDNRKKRELAGFRVSQEKLRAERPKKGLLEIAYFKDLRRQIHLFFFFKKNREMKEERLFTFILAAEGILLLFLLFTGKYFLAVAVPFMFHKFAHKIIEMATDSIDYYVDEELPNAIRHVIKALTKTSDLKTVVYEAGRNIREPLRSHFMELSRRMVTENHEQAINDFADELDNTWVYAFSFLLLSYKDASRKRDIVDNLAGLAEMVEREASLKKQGVVEKRGVVGLNYLLIGGAILGFLGNLYLGDFAMTFFFETVRGMLIMLAGFSLVGMTILVNLMLSKRQF